MNTIQVILIATPFVIAVAYSIYSLITMRFERKTVGVAPTPVFNPVFKKHGDNGDNDNGWEINANEAAAQVDSIPLYFLSQPSDDGDK